jgi:hypothetical protein
VCKSVQKEYAQEKDEVSSATTMQEASTSAFSYTRQPFYRSLHNMLHCAILFGVFQMSASPFCYGYMYSHAERMAVISRNSDKMNFMYYTIDGVVLLHDKTYATGLEPS